GITGWTVRDRAALEQEVARDRAARQAALEKEITGALGEAEAAYRGDRLPEAEAAVKRAEGLLASGGGGAEPRPPRGPRRARPENGLPAGEDPTGPGGGQGGEFRRPGSLPGLPEGVPGLRPGRGGARPGPGGGAPPGGGDQGTPADRTGQLGGGQADRETSPL